MKKIISAILMLSVCITLALGLSSCDNSEEAQMGFKIISTDVNDFSLQVPEDWTVTSQNGYVSATAVGEAGDESNISVMSTALKNAETTAESYFDEVLESYRGLYDNVVIEGEDIETELGERNARKYVFTADLLGVTYRFEQIVCIYGGRAYLFTYTSTPDFYSIHATEVEYIVKYFAFKV